MGEGSPVVTSSNSAFKQINAQHDRGGHIICQPSLLKHTYMGVS